jgi:predicted cupin superfamily sugar epimerase
MLNSLTWSACSNIGAMEQSRIDLLINRLNLQLHPEGGFYAAGFRSQQTIHTDSLKDYRWKGPRNLYSSIYFMLVTGHHSAWHRLASDEIWHFYEGDSIRLHVIGQDGIYHQQTLGSDAENICYQWLVKGGEWMAATTSGNKGYSLLGCTLSPGFDFEDFELATEEELQRSYPNLTPEMKQMLPRS